MECKRFFKNVLVLLRFGKRVCVFVVVFSHRMQPCLQGLNSDHVPSKATN